MRDGQVPLAAELIESVSFGAIEEEGYARGFSCIAGLDEVGRGPLAGPVVAAAVVLPRGFSHDGIKDSKLLTAKQREQLAPVIRSQAESWAIGVVEVEEIDRINILKASLLAMAKAFVALRTRPDYLLIDGNQQIPMQMLQISNPSRVVPPQQKTIVKGDRLCLSIAAASILAKVARDAMMIELDAHYPQYGFAGHKGYGSAAHLEALRRFGPSPVHRRSFKPVRDVCGEHGNDDSDHPFKG
ncbi:MAG: ribonuclease HII [Deltaproteobacteria bacterium]|nr:ribonuclease HII [Deltaproteobacteria bacterium]